MTTGSESLEPQSPNEQKKKTELGAAWIKRITKAHKALKGWRAEAKTAYDAYWVDAKKRGDERFPLFWANTQIQHSAVLEKAPTAEVRRRNTDVQGPQKELAKCIERALNYQFDIQDCETALHSAVDDFLIAGAGLVRVSYDPEIQTDEEGYPVAILNQGLSLEHVPYARVTWEPNKAWANVDWVAIEHLLSKQEFKEQFPGKEMPESSVEGEGAGAGEGEQPNPEAAKYTPLFRVFEVFDKKRNRIVVVAEGEDEPLETRTDELGLNGFFPFARPMFMNLKKDELIPKPEYTYIQPQLNYINRLTQRIDKITAAIKDVGFYDDALAELSQLEGADDGTMVPLRGLAERLGQAGGGARLEVVMAKLPIDQLAMVLSHLRDMREDSKAQVYEITGISDIVRGVTDPNETATAQSQKSQWAGARFGRKEQEVIRFVRDTVRVMGEIVCEHFEPEILAKMTGVQIDQEMVTIMREDMSRSFAVDIETDSTILADERAEQESRQAMLSAVSEFLPVALETMQNNPATGPLMGQMLLFLTRSFKHGRQLEDEIEAMLQQFDPVGEMQTQLQELQQQFEQCQADLQAAQEQLGQVDQAEMAREDQETQIDGMTGQAKANLDNAKAEQTRQETQQQNVVAQIGSMMRGV